MLIILLWFLLQLPCEHEFRNPAPLFIGSQYAAQRIENFCISTNYVPDVGAYEYWPPATPWKPGDFSLNNRVTPYDYYWFRGCFSGAGVPHRTMLTFATGGELEVGCWLADFDADGDVDLADFAVFQRADYDWYLWGDANDDCMIDLQDYIFVDDCMEQSGSVRAGGVCYRADLNESSYVNENDLQLMFQILDEWGNP